MCLKGPNRLYMHRIIQIIPYIYPLSYYSAISTISLIAGNGHPQSLVLLWRRSWCICFEPRQQLCHSITPGIHLGQFPAQDLSSCRAWNLVHVEDPPIQSLIASQPGLHKAVHFVFRERRRRTVCSDNICAWRFRAAVGEGHADNSDVGDLGVFE